MAAHTLCIFLIVTLSTCSFRRFKKPEHRVYTFNLIDPSLISMRKTTVAPARAEKKPAVPKVDAKKKPEKKQEKKPAKKAPKEKPPKDKFTMPKKSIEERIKEQLKKIEDETGGEWAEPGETLKREKSELLAAPEGFTNIAYSDAVAARIYEFWHTPSKIAAQAEKLTVVVRFRIMRDGKVKIIGVEKRSGNEILDSSALQAIQDAQPLPPLPEDYKADSLEVCMIFVPEE